MQVVEYGRDKLIGGAALCAGLAALGMWFYPHSRGFLALIVVIMTPLLAAGAIAIAAKLFGDRVAIRFDARTLVLQTLWNKYSGPWSDLIDFGVERVTTYGLYGLVKTGQTDSFYVKVAGGLTGTRKFSFNTALLDLGPRGLDGLFEMLAEGRGRAVPGVTATGAATPCFGTRTTPAQRDPLMGMPQADTFDPDAVMARYIANRDAAAALTSVAPPLTPPVAPVRPSFGRKAV